MKKKVLVLVAVAAMLGGYLTANTYAQPVEIIKIADNGGGGGGGFNHQRARNVWCQVLTPREGCRKDPSRTCTHTNFCE